MDPGQRGLPPQITSFLMGIIACAALYYYCKDGSLLNDFVRTCCKLLSSLYFFFIFWWWCCFFLFVWSVGSGFVLKDSMVTLPPPPPHHSPSGIVSKAFNYWKIACLSFLSHRRRQMWFLPGFCPLRNKALETGLLFSKGVRHRDHQLMYICTC